MRSSARTLMQEMRFAGGFQIACWAFGIAVRHVAIVPEGCSVFFYPSNGIHEAQEGGRNGEPEDQRRRQEEEEGRVAQAPWSLAPACTSSSVHLDDDYALRDDLKLKSRFRIRNGLSTNPGSLVWSRTSP